MRCLVVIAVLGCAAVATAQPAPPAAGGDAETAVDDPLLAAPAPAPTELQSWDDARRLLAAGSPALQRADSAVARAEARVAQARAALLPTARAGVAGELDLLHPDTAPGIPPGTDYEPTSPLGTATITATQSVLDVGAWRGRAAARADRTAARLDRVDTDRRLTRAVAHAILAVAAAVRSSELDRLGLRQALERAAISRRTFQLGAATELDVVRVEQDVAVARSAVIAGDEELRLAREELGLVLGVDGEVGVGPGLTADQLLAGVTGECRPLRDGELRADLAAADAAVVAAREREDEARAGYYPTIDLTTSLFAFTADPGGPVRAGSWTVLLQVSVPLWEGGLRGGLIAERRAAVELSQIEAADARRVATVEVARSERGDEVARQLVDTALEARDLAARVDTMTRKSFQIGRATSLELVQSAGVLRQADLTLTAREFELERARIDELLAEARCGK
jgi:outer membrane protein TolC